MAVMIMMTVTGDPEEINRITRLMSVAVRWQRGADREAFCGRHYNFI
jgi:hypothetical protein